MDSDYQTYRGRCKEMSETAIAAEPSLRLVRGYYHCPVWGKQEHWWTERPDGTIFDPTAKQFPSKGIGEYEEWDGVIPCEQCGKPVDMNEASIDGHHVFCSYECHGRCVGVF